jgi:hypothetical protein
MSYEEKNVIAKYTKGNAVSDCGEYNLNDLLDMFDETLVTNLPFETTVNECIDDNTSTLTIDLAVTEEDGDMFCYAIDKILLKMLFTTHESNIENAWRSQILFVYLYINKVNNNKNQNYEKSKFSSRKCSSK